MITLVIGLPIHMPSLLEAVKAKRDSFRYEIISWARRNLRSFPWREDPTPYSILIAEILLRRTTAAAVRRVYSIFMERYPNIESLAKAEIYDLMNIIAPLGYHKERAKILRKIADYILKRYEGKIPCSKADLMQIPHIGQYTAGAILSLGFGIPSSMVDSNVERVIRRVFSSKVPAKGQMTIVIKIADLLVPETDHKIYNLGLIDHGALICRFDNPRCDGCPLENLCEYSGFMVQKDLGVAD